MYIHITENYSVEKKSKLDLNNINEAHNHNATERGQTLVKYSMNLLYEVQEQVRTNLW